MGGGRLALYNLTKTASDINRLVNHRDWNMATLTQLSFLFTLTYLLFICLNPGLAPPHLPVRVFPSLLLERFCLLLWSRPLIPSFLASPTEIWPSCFVLEQPGYTQSILANAPSNTHWVDPLQHPATHPPHIGLAPPHGAPSLHVRTHTNTKN